MRIFKTASFHKLAKKEKLDDAALESASTEIINGLVDAKLGGQLYKKRIATKNRGKRGSVRTILAYKENDKMYYLYVFEKNQRDNITKKEKEVFKILADNMLSMTDKDIDRALQKKTLHEIILTEKPDDPSITD